jgi:hypothetical protein
MIEKNSESYGDAETARRRDAVVKAMIATPPTPHKPMKKREPAKASPRRKPNQKSKGS